MARKHATIERPTEEQLLELVQGKAASIGRLYLEAHRLVLQTLPDVVYVVDCDDAVISYGVRQYGYDGWGLLPFRLTPSGSIYISCEAPTWTIRSESSKARARGCAM